MTDQKLRLKLDTDKLKRIVTSTMSKPNYNNSANGGEPSGPRYREYGNGGASPMYPRARPAGDFKSKGNFKGKSGGGFGKPRRPFTNTNPKYIKKERPVNPNPPSTFDLHLKALQEKFPKAFPFETRLPLASKIRHSIAEALGVSNKEANLFLFWYCHGSKYLDNFNLGANKIDLDGNLAGQVTIEDIKAKNKAFTILQESIQKKKDLEIAKQNEVAQDLSHGTTQVTAQDIDKEEIAENKDDTTTN